MTRKLNTRLTTLAAVTLAAVALTVTAVAAPEPEREHGGKRIGDEPRHRPMHRAELRKQGPPPRGVSHAFGFMGHPQVEVNVTENDDGVTIHLTTDNSEIAERLRAKLPEQIEKMRTRTRAREERREELGALREKARRRMGGQLHLPASDKVHAKVVPTDKGADIVIASDDPDVARRIKNTVPKQIEARKHFRRALKERIAEHPGILRSTRQMVELMSSPEVNIELAKTDRGVTLVLTSDNPEAAERLKGVMAERIEHLRHMREKMEKTGERPRYGQPRSRPLDPELREMIRQEIRRYLEEQGREG